MCRPTNCKTCANTTWAGCGQHIDQVKASVPADNWCAGHPKTAREGGGMFSTFFRRS